MLKINRLHFTQEVHDTTPEGQQKMKDMNLYAKSKKITISNGTPMISYRISRSKQSYLSGKQISPIAMRIKKVIPIFSAHRRKKLVW